MMTKIFAAVGIALLYLAFLGQSCEAGAAKNSGIGATEIVFYRVEGAHSPFKFTEVVVSSNGSVLARFFRYGDKKDSSASFQLNVAELENLKVLVSSVSFFSLAGVNTSLAKDYGQSTLRISLNGNQRELHYSYIPEIEPLLTFLWKLHNQGVILVDFLEKDELYNVLSSVSGTTGPPRILQPRIYLEPLTVFISTSNSQQKLAWAIEALAWITTPEEWGKILSDPLENSEEAHKNLLLTVLSTPGFPLPYSHAKLAPALLFKELKRKAKVWPKLSKNQLKVYNSVVYHLGYSRYEPAVPILVKLIQDAYPDLNSYLEHTSSIRSALPQMERSVLDPLESLLTNKIDEVRASAADMLGETLDRNSNYPPIITPEDMAYILNRLRTVIAPKLEIMHKSDSSERVRNAAKRSLDRIARGWNK